MPQISGHKRQLSKSNKPYKHPNKKQKKNDHKHPFQSSANNSKKSIIKLDKSSKPKYVRPNGPLSKKDLRERKRQRKFHKSNGKLRTELNFLSSSHHNTNSDKLSKRPRKEQHLFVGELLTKMKGNILKLVKNLDSTRTIQTAIKYGSQNQINEITKELKGHFIDLCCGHYSHRTVRALLEYGREYTRNIIVSELMKAITRLILHRLASNIVDYAIMVIADENVRRMAFQYFVSPKFILMTQYESESKTVPKTINNILKEASDKIEKTAIIKSMGKFIISGFEKEIISTGIFQTILSFYIHSIYFKKKKFEELIEFMLPSLMELQNVKSGVISLIYVIHYSMNLKPKLRKLLVKNQSDFVIGMCCDKHSYLIVCKLLDTFDDSVLLKKQIISKLNKSLHILMFHDFGRLVLLHLLTPRSERYFGKNKLYQMCLSDRPMTKSEFESKQFLMCDEDSDSDSDSDDCDMSEPLKQYSIKKEYSVKRMEILKHFLPNLIEFCCENIKKILCHDLAGTVVIELLRLLFSFENEFETEKLIQCIVRVTLSDTTPRQMSPEPVMPEMPTHQLPNVEITNVVSDSLKLVQNKNTNLQSIDISKMDPNSAKTVYKLQQKQQMSKNKSVFMKLNAEFEIKMIEYQLVMIRHKKKIKTEDESHGIMEHGLGHRRVRKMVEEFGSEQFHKYFIDCLLEKDTKELIYFLSVKGVYVIWELYNQSSDEIKQKLTQILKPACVKMKDVIQKEQQSDNDKNNYQGLSKLCHALSVDL